MKGPGGFFLRRGPLPKIFLSKSLLSNFLVCPMLSSICFLLCFLARDFLSGGCFSAGGFVGDFFGEGTGVW